MALRDGIVAPLGTNGPGADIPRGVCSKGGEGSDLVSDPARPA